eukprot:CAMPEP_0194565292 /NCGR_PEP_ID=MMETSP0292-20121207/4612_1 /TAXON_ID=39354 /ORGANISM="Heterosigma akashiwo, Strain CCMP2393" /LENGTH=41 /DNA_ID= /DNA_START= /DNA_END= /DNA_ORIENTATION=
MPKTPVGLMKSFLEMKAVAEVASIAIAMQNFVLHLIPLNFS